MATDLSVALTIEALIDFKPTSPNSGAVVTAVRNALGGRRWTNGTASGNADSVYIVTGALTSGSTNSYDTLAAGALLDPFGVAIDLDELKGLVIVPTSGTMRLEAPAANFIGLFDDASDLINVPAGGLALDFGAAGLDVATNSKFDITETAASTGGYTLILWGAS